MRPTLLLLPFLALLGCRPAGEDTASKEERCDPVTRYQDDDGDGFGDASTAFETCKAERGVAEAGDCDDADPSIHPGAEEDCTVALDTNCDGSVGYADADADGTPACEDCDDTDSTRAPGAAETCDGIDQDCDGVPDDEPVDGRFYYADSDGDTYGDPDAALRSCEQPDGHVTDLTDCDDTNAAVHPAADELCDEVDNNCDGATDDVTAVDIQTWYADFDADGHGADDRATISCEQPRRHVAEAGDCDDTDASVNPAGTELCDGLDNNCDGVTDEASAADAYIFYTDADGDGHGDLTSTVLACAVPAGASALGDDCDDADATAWPGAHESCDGVDDDCDGTVDDDPVDAPTWYEDDDGDGYGAEATSLPTCGAPAGAVAAGGDCDDADRGTSPGATESCNGVDDDCDGSVDEADASDAVTWYADTDGDGFGDATRFTAACTQPAGYVALASDCDDTDANVNPGATELCDGGDENCDGTVDEADAADTTTWYADADSDGWGDPAITSTACDAPPGFVSAGGDCDDDAADYHPGAPEADCDDPNDYNCDGSVGLTDGDGDGWVACEDCDDTSTRHNPTATETCDGTDEDCDGTTDEDAPDAPTWFGDADGDGHGDPTRSVAACEAPAAYVMTGTDCDDADAGVNPDAAESCHTAADDDCDGSTNERNADGCTRWYWDQDEDSYGSTTNACYCDPVGYLTAASSGDCDDGDSTVNPGANEQWANGVDDDCDVDVDWMRASAAADARLLGAAAADALGRSLTGLGDLDGDGYGDLLLAAFDADGGGATSGEAYVVLGPVEGDLDLGTADALLLGEDAGDAAGTAVAGPGDVNGDGVPDLLIGAPGRGSGNEGVAYLVYGPVTGTLDLSAADAVWESGTRSANAGEALGGGFDLDGDGVVDAAIGAPGDTYGGTGAGTVYLVSGTTTGTNNVASANALIFGEDAQDGAGNALRVVSDIDGDGVADLLVAATGDDGHGSGSGAAYLLQGPLSGSIDLATADAKLRGEGSGDSAGSALAADDFDGDGLADVVVGASNAGTGIVYIVSSPSGTVELSDADATLTGDGDAGAVGTSVATLGDTDGDGAADLLLGDPQYDASGLAQAGAAWLVPGPLAGNVSLGDSGSGLYGESTSEYLGYGVGAAGDVDGDGLDDILVGAEGNDETDTNAGIAYLLYGR